MTLPTLTRRRRLAAAVAALTLASLATAGPLVGPASADAQPTPSRSADRGLLSLSVPTLDPVRVSPDGTFAVPVTNTGTSLLDVRLSLTSQGGLSLGLGSLTLGGNDQGTPLLQLSTTGLAHLTDQTAMTATVHVSVLGGLLSIDRPIRLVAPSATPVLKANRSNPLAGVPWANYEGRAEPTYAPYTAARGALKNTLASIEFQPKARWFVSNLPPAQLGDMVRSYVQEATASDPNALVQLTMFTIDPWEDAACQALPTQHQLALDKAYIHQFVQGIGSARALVVVQPDGPYAGCAPHGSKVLAKLVGSAVHQLAQLPRTTSYIDMGSADWHRGDTSKELPLLLAENIKEARGFSMDVTHTDSTGAQILHARKLITELAQHGVTGKKAVIDTSDNGRPFGGAEWRPTHPNQGPWAAPACHSKTQKLCVALGIPPTTDVADQRWGLTKQQNRLAAKYVDAYLWIKRPWLDPFAHYTLSMKRALDEIRTSPFFSSRPSVRGRDRRWSSKEHA